MKQVELKLQEATSTVAVYRLSIHGSDAYFSFSIPIDSEESIFSSERFIHMIHRGSRLLAILDPEYHQEQVAQLFQEEQS